MKAIVKSYRSVRNWFRYLNVKRREKRHVTPVTDFKNIPVIINNFNRYTFLKMLIGSLERRGYRNIHIIDNDSTYPPLLEYYKTLPYEIFYLKKNVGFLALWKTDIYKRFRDRHFVYTDPDIVMIDECPDNFMELFYLLLMKYKRAVKVGFGLKIDDLPDHFRKKQEVIEWESRFWKNELEPDIYKADIDTTFALYRPNVRHLLGRWGFCIRTGGKYTARHMPWYNDDENYTEEELYYIRNTKQSTHWTTIANEEVEE